MAEEYVIVQPSDLLPDGATVWIITPQREPRFANDITPGAGIQIGPITIGYMLDFPEPGSYFRTNREWEGRQLAELVSIYNGSTRFQMLALATPEGYVSNPQSVGRQVGSRVGAGARDTGEALGDIVSQFGAGAGEGLFGKYGGWIVGIVLLLIVLILGYVFIRRVT